MKKSLRFFAALWLCKAINGTTNLFLHRKSTHAIGAIAEKICPDMLGRFTRPEKIYMVTGTNGKTTTSNLLFDFLQKHHKHIISNRAGSNLREGIVAAFLEQTTLSGKNKGDLAMLEMDERSAKKVFEYLTPDILLITNLFQDSDKRNATVSFIRDFLDTYIPEKTKLLVNADDVISSYLKYGKNPRITYSFPQQPDEENNIVSIVQDVKICPHCQAAVVYDFIRYHHIGRLHCPHCGFANLPADIAVKQVDYSAQKLVLEVFGNTETYPLIGQNQTDIYNELAFVSLLRSEQVPADTIAADLSDITILESRFEETKVLGLPFTFISAKGENAVATSRTMDFVRRQPGRKMFILVNLDVDMLADNNKDSRYTLANNAWIWNTDFEYLADDSIEVVAGGNFAHDLVVRLRYAGVKETHMHIVPNLWQLYENLDFTGISHVYYCYDWYQKQYCLHLMDKMRQSGSNKNGN